MLNAVKPAPDTVTELVPAEAAECYISNIFVCNAAAVASARFSIAILPEGMTDPASRWVYHRVFLAASESFCISAMVLPAGAKLVVVVTDVEPSNAEVIFTATGQRV